MREEVIPLDEADPGPSNHERAIYRGELLDPKTRKVRGTELGICIVGDAEQDVRLVCQIVFTPSATSSLSTADQITAQTIFDNVQTSKPQRTAITGAPVGTQGSAARSWPSRAPTISSTSSSASIGRHASSSHGDQQPPGRGGSWQLTAARAHEPPGLDRALALHVDEP